VKKYHPDQHRGNPLANLAQEKLKEINEAYEYLMNKLEGQENTAYTHAAQSQYHPDLQQVRMQIQKGNLDGAAELLKRVNIRNAEWYYLSGMIALKRGWYAQAFDQFTTAVQMDPFNPEYAEALGRMRTANNQYYHASRQRGYRSTTNFGLCDCCTCLICSDCCCECAGGDLIDCC